MRCHLEARHVKGSLLALVLLLGGIFAARERWGRNAVVPAAGTFELTVKDPDGKLLPRAPVEIYGDPPISAAQVRQGKFLRTEAGAVLVEAGADGRVVLDVPVELWYIQCGVELPGFAPPGSPGARRMRLSGRST